MVQEQTIREAINFSGVGLHSGAAVQMSILPAPVGTGVCFRRVDLDGFSIEAVRRNVAKVSYATSLMKRGVLISTTASGEAAQFAEGWADRIKIVTGTWADQGPALDAVLIRPDGYVAWTYPDSGGDLAGALGRWFGTARGAVTACAAGTVGAAVAGRMVPAEQFPRS